MKPGSAAAPDWAARTLVAACAVVLVFYAWLLAPSKADWGNTHAPGAYYNLLVEGFIHHRLDLPVEIPSGLAKLPDPWDPAANAEFRIKGHLHDTSYYHGKIYLYFGPTPALILFGPWRLITGHYLYNKQAVFVFVAVGFLAAAALWREIVATYFSRTGLAVTLIGTLALGLATSVVVMLWEPSTHAVAMACAHACLMLSCLALWHSCHGAPHRQARWLAWASVGYGLAVGARPSLFPGATILLLPAAMAIFHPDTSRRVAVARLGAAGLLPLLSIAIGLALYNHARFGNSFEFGQRYQLAGDRQDTARHFSASYLWFNFRMYFLRWNALSPNPEAGVELPTIPSGHAAPETAYGILWHTPLVWLVGALPIVWRASGSGRLPLRWMVGGLVFLFGTTTAVICMFYNTHQRYQVEFQPVLVLLAGIGLVALIDVLPAGRARRVALAGAGAAVIFSAASSVLTCLRWHASDLNAQGIIAAQAGNWATAAERFAAALRRDPAPPVIWQNAGFAHLNSGHAAEAEGHFRQAVALAPDSALNRLGLGLSLEANGDRAAARSHLARAFLSDRKMMNRYLLEADAKFQKGAVAEAANSYQMVIDIQPDSAAAENGLGCALLRLGKSVEAVSHLERATQLNPNFTVAFANLGDVLLHLDRRPEAIRAFERALALDPNFPGVAEALRAAGR